MKLSRRDFLGTTVALGATLPMMGMMKTVVANEAPTKNYRTKLFKAYIDSAPTEESCKKFAAAGFQGLEVENWQLDLDMVKANRKIAESYGLKVHSVMRGWADLNADDPATVRASIDSIIQSIKVASAYGADAVLLVPCRIANPGPKPWEFNIEFDGNCKVSSVVAGDNAPYQEYIDLQNKATERTFEALQEVIPVAAYEGVTIALENVWNQLWVTPDFAAAFVRMFDSLWVRAYLDLGNNVKYAPTVDWVRALGSELIAKLHIKDYCLNEETKKDPEAGFCGLGHGSFDWVEVRDALEEQNVSSWVSYEEPNYTPEEYSAILDDFFCGRKIVAPK